jgi:hypothetical protein
VELSANGFTRAEDDSDPIVSIDDLDPPEGGNAKGPGVSIPVTLIGAEGPARPRGVLRQTIEVPFELPLGHPRKLPKAPVRGGGEGRSISHACGARCLRRNSERLTRGFASRARWRSRWKCSGGT